MSRSLPGLPYWRLSGFYFFYFATVGALLPYWGLYLQSLGFDAAAIGELIAILVGTKIVAPYLWGWIADHHGRRMHIVRLASLISALSFTGIFLGHGYLLIALVMLVFGFFWNASLPQFEATTLNHLGDSVTAYTRIRVWGSVGFIISVSLLGVVLQDYGVSTLPALLLLMLLGIWVSSELVPEDAAGHLRLEQRPLLEIVGRPPVLALLACCFLIQASHGPYYTFYSIYLEAHAYSRTLIGQLWALGVLAEVVLFMGMHRILPRVGVRRLLLWSLGLSVVRWLLIGWYVDKLALLIFAQILHAASFGVFHAAAIQLIHRYFSGRLQGRGQALYSSLSFGAGGAVGTLLSGYAWDGLGAGMTYSLAAAVSLLALVIAWRWIED